MQEDGRGDDSVDCRHGVKMIVTPAQSEMDWREAHRLVVNYAGSLNLDLSFQKFEDELENLARVYGPPEGAFLMAEDQGQYVGCVGLRHFADDAGELKRLYVIPSARGRGIGRMLAEAIVQEAKKLGYKRLLLDTLPSMKTAQSLCVSLGFIPTAEYRFNPVKGTTFLQLEL